MEEINKRCISRKEYLKKYDSNVGYALYVQDNIRKDDYVRLNTGDIVKVIGIKANTVNKRAIYYGFYKQNWFDSAAVENFSDNIIDLIENKDVLKVRIDKTIMFFGMDEDTLDIKYKELIENIENGEYELVEILTHEQFESNCYKVGGEDDEV